MNVLVACEYSGIVRDAFIAKGHNAMSCDLLPTDAPNWTYDPFTKLRTRHPERGSHYQGSVLDVLNDAWGWDLMIAHPPCTYLANSGARWLWKDSKNGIKNLERWEKLDKAAEFFRALMNADIPKICIENPIMLSYGIERIGRKYDQLVQPYQFGHKETKATCFWLKGLEPLKHTTDYKEETLALPAKIRGRLSYLPPSPDRWKLRSKTYTGIAQAMAEQWG